MKKDKVLNKVKTGIGKAKQGFAEVGNLIARPLKTVVVVICGMAVVLVACKKDCKKQPKPGFDIVDCEYVPVNPNDPYAAAKQECANKSHPDSTYSWNDALKLCQATYIGQPPEPFRADTIKFNWEGNYFSHHTNLISYEEKALDLMNYSDTTGADKIVLVPCGTFEQWQQSITEKTVNRLWTPIFTYSDKFEANGNFENLNVPDTTANRLRAFGWLVNGH